MCVRLSWSVPVLCSLSRFTVIDRKKYRCTRMIAEVLVVLVVLVVVVER